MTFAHAFSRSCRERPHHAALVAGGVELSYAETAQRAAAVAGELRRLGVAPGDRVAVIARNRLEVALLMVAAATVGVAVAPVNWRLAADTVAEVVRELAPRAILASGEFAGAARAVTGNDDGRTTRADEAAVIDLDAGDDRWLGLGDALSDRVAVRGSDLLTMMSTSGSTGRPKGVAISQSAIVARALVLHAELGVEPSDAFVGWAPLFHISSADYLYATLVLGGTFVLHERFDANAIANELVARDIGWLFLVPGLIDELLAALGDRRPRSLKCVGAMADLVPVDQLRRAERRLGAPYLNTFGSTEAGLVPGASAIEWVGGEPVLEKRATLFCQYRIVDGRGEDVSPGSVGELWLRGPTLFAGYWTGAGVTKADFCDGWFQTGDLVRSGAEGLLTFVERRGRMFKCGGENVYPAAIERVLLSDPAVLEAAVVPEPHPRLGQAPAAYLALAQPADASRIVASATATLARFERPQAVHVLRLDEFPRGVTGKVERDRLKAAHAACGRDCLPGSSLTNC